MTTPFLYPTITSVPCGYSYYSTIPVPRLLATLATKDADILIVFKAFHDADCKVQEERLVTVRDCTLVGAPPRPFLMEDHSDKWGVEPGFVEMTFSSLYGKPVFLSKRPFAFYTVFSAVGKKSFLTDNTFKFGSPPVIDQIAMFGRFTDSYPIVHVDRMRDLGESLIVINPYQQAILFQVVSHDDRKSRRVRIPARTARYFRLIELLEPDEIEWIGQIQITANNRLITFSVKHSLADPSIITTHEHLDPFRADPTHVPATQWLRNYIGERLKSAGLL